MEKRNLPFAEAYVFTHDEADVVKLLDEVADFFDSTDGLTLFAIQYTNSFEGGYHESLIVTVERTPESRQIVQLDNGITVSKG